jgi:hypothetical protein
MRCVNEECDRNPINSINSVVATIDGDFACDDQCMIEYEKQKSRFLNETIHDDDKFCEWLDK